MKEKIEKINQTIEEKRKRLKEKVERGFATIVIPSHIPTSDNTSSKTQSVPPISYILYGIAGLAAVGAFLSDSKILCAGLAAISAYGGYRLSNSNKSASVSQSPSTNINTIKNEVASKVLEILKNTIREWEEFMENKQKEVQQIISLSTNSSVQKDAMMSKVVLYEVIDISMSEFSNMIIGISSINELKSETEAYKLKLLKAVDEASTKQIEKYNSIC